MRSFVALFFFFSKDFNIYIYIYIFFFCVDKFNSYNGGEGI